MSAKTLAACSFEPPAKRSIAGGNQSRRGRAAETQFREELWREYQSEAITAGLNSAQATEYANALSPDLGLLASRSGMVPLRHGWFYQAHLRVAKQTIVSGLLTLMRWKKSKATGRFGTSGIMSCTFGFRPWNPAGKS